MLYIQMVYGPAILASARGFRQSISQTGNDASESISSNYVDHNNRMQATAGPVLRETWLTPYEQFREKNEFIYLMLYLFIVHLITLSVHKIMLWNGRTISI
jgi:hypothetical protein